MTNVLASVLEPVWEQLVSVPVVVDCVDGIDRPRWGLVADSFYADLTADLRDAFSVGPMFHVKDDGSGSGQPFHVSITLNHAVFATGLSAKYEPLFHTTTTDFKPVSVSFLDATHAVVTWTPPTIAATGDWDRWIVKLRIEEKDSPGNACPIFLGFSCLKSERKSALQKQLMPDTSSLGGAAVSPVAVTGGALKLRVRIDLEGEDDPLFPELFQPRKEIGLPEHVYLEPLITFKKAGEGKLFDLEFTSTCSIFFAGEPSGCNPGTPEKDPLALAWMGVTNPKVECRLPEEPVSHGFVVSWIDPEEKVAIVRWREQPEEVDAVRQRVASFFFVNRSAISVDPTVSGTLHFGNALIDPTIVYDKDDPPA